MSFTSKLHPHHQRRNVTKTSATPSPISMAQEACHFFQTQRNQTKIKLIDIFRWKYCTFLPEKDKELLKNKMLFSRCEAVVCKV